MRCRICWEEEESPGKLQAPSTDNHLISPCRCKGTVRWVHVTCLRHWRAAHSPSDDSFKKCLLCGANYRMKWRPLARIVASPHALQGIALMVTFIALLASCTVAVKFSGLWLPLLHYKAPWVLLVDTHTRAFLSKTSPLPLAPTPLETIVSGMTLLSFVSYLFFCPQLVLPLAHLLLLLYVIIERVPFFCAGFVGMCMWGVWRAYGDVVQWLEAKVQGLLLDQLIIVDYTARGSDSRSSLKSVSQAPP